MPAPLKAPRVLEHQKRKVNAGILPDQQVPSVGDKEQQVLLNQSWDRYGIGIQFEYDLQDGVVLVRSISRGAAVPFRIGDKLLRLDGNSILQNPALAPSLIFGAKNSNLHVCMLQDGVEVEAWCKRGFFVEDENMLSILGGTKACGIGVVLDKDPVTSLFVVKKVFHNSPAYLAGLRSGHLIYSIDGKTVHALSKDQLPGLLLGKQGTSISLTFLTKDAKDVKHVDVVRTVDTARAQMSNVSARVCCNLLGPSSRSISLQELKKDIVFALWTSPNRVVVTEEACDAYAINVHILPDIEGEDSRSVQEVVSELEKQLENSCSCLRKTSFGGHLRSQSSSRRESSESDSTSVSRWSSASTLDRTVTLSSPLSMEEQPTSKSPTYVDLDFFGAPGAMPSITLKGHEPNASVHGIPARVVSMSDPTAPHLDVEIPLSSCSVADVKRLILRRLESESSDMELWHEGRHLPPSTDVRELWMKQQQAGSLRLAYSLTRSPVFKPIRISHGQGMRSVEGLRESGLATRGSDKDSFSPAELVRCGIVGVWQV
ncbi:hypothetical protein GUITHDRAFT_112140 [Guillardia theta CCMP2712]|uniref:PDZ domain-containing protein n=1 Tax=Guillardia theta (strain CCMP2712) TaxID=905079 RepID=L1J0R2_GUITC|nr:hypothetical protein GUITHDRAFT_112140 [Guillardia theta CCMP2712]EKX41724.1 hypothetical protein GUITHDRAFT_112140 [Guillardia theta CCMP2712]|eukprot:XP_005828704.1 hypothetical protein GUITHDRAFT_112140 [Guillardia theta CCMP2712]